MSSPHLLIVDDEPFNLDIVADYLVDDGYRLTLADSGEAAWAALNRPGQDIDLIVLDRMMPGTDGMEIMRRLRADPALADIPVIMQTAAAAPEQVREGLSAGVYYYLTKPFEPESLRCIIDAALDDLRTRRALLARLDTQTSALGLVRRAGFVFSTIAEAESLAALLGSLNPHSQFMALGLAELFFNAVEHGNLGIDFDEKSRLRRAGQWHEELARRQAAPEYAGRSVRVELTREGDQWRFEIEDDGQGFAWQEFFEPDPRRATAPNGRGILLARELAFDSLHYCGQGNRVVACARDRNHD